MREKEEKEKKILCPFCKRRKITVGVICLCEVKDTGMAEFWKD